MEKVGIRRPIKMFSREDDKRGAVSSSHFVRTNDFYLGLQIVLVRFILQNSEDASYRKEHASVHAFDFMLSTF